MLWPNSKSQSFNITCITYVEDYKFKSYLRKKNELYLFNFTDCDLKIIHLNFRRVVDSLRKLVESIDPRARLHSLQEKKIVLEQKQREYALDSPPLFPMFRGRNKQTIPLIPNITEKGWIPLKEKAQIDCF